MRGTPTDLSLSDKVALVAGSSRGIGYAIASALLREGARVVMTGRNEASLSAAVASLNGATATDRVLPLAGDLTDSVTCAQCVERARSHWGRLDIVVGNVGLSKGTPGWDVPDDEWNQMLCANLLGAVRLVRATVPALTEHGGSIVLTASIAGIQALPAPLPYSVAKSALIAGTVGLARLLASKQIRVNAVAPGNIYFAGGTWERLLAQQPQECRAYVEREVPLQRFGRPEEIADVAVFLASERASFMTGTCVVVDGGQTRAFQ